MEIRVLGMDTCNVCPVRKLIRNGMNAMHRSRTLSAGTATNYVIRTCDGCVAEGSVEESEPGLWSVYLLAYADDPDGYRPADGSPR